MSTDSKSLITRIASRYGVDSTKFFETLKATAFKQRDGSAPTNDQMMVLLVVAEQYNLNPFTREIYAFPDRQNGIIPVVGVDGWSRIINEHPQHDGVEFVYADKMVRMEGANVDCPEWIECVIYRKDRSRPIRIKEFIDEVYRGPAHKNGQNGPYVVNGPWQTHTKRQLRHKSLIQCSRVAFGFSGIYDQDEAERIREMEQASAINPAIASLPSPAQVHSQEPLAIEHKELDPILIKLANRAIAENAWSAAHEYLKGRYEGSELQYATQFLREKEMDQMEPPKPDYQEAHEQASTAGGSANAEPVAAEVVPPLSDEDMLLVAEEEGAQGCYY
ncbi:TPA: phage recombination protein Bet [Escherichia coli]|uniref:Bet n=10 Tax=Gammaproteobacteria TaxID=1236 RepID=A0A6C9CPV8_ECOLX|nr:MULTISPECIES: phage recombination protein Bet [Gammaproteobacteria]EAA9556247.1 phage recombination protein Bet [Salmonella enterica subsp. enterica serovar Montevideo]EAM8395215.1 phage recombination protein Bet [Salmonella enterica]EBB4011795.1 phage recombination protein Bet [Salmonella enterica subsp. enterica serovar Ohio]EDQ6812949.1 phage recombination protein Bet [Salmonella enterica subsp. enterica serovar 4,[5],12:i:-]EKV0915312.1 phage recombination protein Bet [Pluralibacter ger